LRNFSKNISVFGIFVKSKKLQQKLHMKRLLILFAIISQFSCSSNNKDSISVKFNENGTFKIVQFTDTHYVPGNQKSTRADSVIKLLIETEKPDLIVFTGDQVYGRPVEEALDRQFSIVDEHNIPFIYTFGNHDREQKMSGMEILKIAKQYKGFLLDYPEDTTLGITYGYLPILSSKCDSTASVIYIFDSRDYSTLKENDVKGYGWMPFGQINWYTKISESFTKSNNGKPVPSIAFFHIPLPEYKEAIETGAPYVGTYQEKVCSPAINSGLFTRMLENKDVFATFVGHDHDNNYTVFWKGMCLSYGNFSGGDTEYNHIPAGARVIELHEGKQELKTWIHLLNGEIKDEVTLPNYFK